MRKKWKRKGQEKEGMKKEKFRMKTRKTGSTPV